MSAGTPGPSGPPVTPPPVVDPSTAAAVTPTAPPKVAAQTATNPVASPAVTAPPAAQNPRTSTVSNSGYSLADIEAYFKKAKQEAVRQAGKGARERELRLKNPGAVERSADTAEFAIPPRWKGSAVYAKGRKGLDVLAQAGLGLPMAILALLLAVMTMGREGEYEKAAAAIKAENPDQPGAVGFDIKKGFASAKLSFYRVDANGNKVPLTESDADQKAKREIIDSIWTRAGFRDEQGNPIRYNPRVAGPAAAVELAPGVGGPKPNPSAPANIIPTTPSNTPNSTNSTPISPNPSP